jgi:LPS-assembly protein
MPLTKKIILLFSLLGFIFTPLAAHATSYTPSLAGDTLAKQLGWVSDPHNFCGGYYSEEPLAYQFTTEKEGTVAVTTGGGLISQRNTSLLEGKVTITRSGQQITANKAYLYRDPLTGKLSAIDMIGNVHLRESNSLVLGKRGRYNFNTTSKSLLEILYRTSIDASRNNKLKSPNTKLTAWGRAYEFAQTRPKVYELWRASYTTCPPTENPAWRVKAQHIILDKNTGRGYATHARIFLKSIPVFYFPYMNFSLDKQRKSGFLWPQIGLTSEQWGPYILAPFYWNMAPNYDMTLTPGLLTKRGAQLSDSFRYLTTASTGNINLSVLPNDKEFNNYKDKAAINPDYINSNNTVTQAELRRLLDSSNTRKAFSWHDDSRYNEHWSSHVDFNTVGDDYYLQNFGRTLNQLSGNQLLQEGDVFYKGQNWNFTGRLQAYQTLHPIDETLVTNNYRRLPQLILSADYPDQPLGLEYFITNEAAHFTLIKTPGAQTLLPVGNRFHTQPGISLPIYWSSFYINPRLQLALTSYNLQQISDTPNTPPSIHRALPIFDLATGVALERDVSLFWHAYQQTLEPQLYYTFIPYKDQSQIPVFDTTVNTLTYDQIFNYNRFTSIDRIGDANQLAFGVTTRLIDQETGLEKVRLGLGIIRYFAERKVTLCNERNVCSDNPYNNSNGYSLSPLSGVLNYHINPAWSFNITNTIWNPISRQLDNSTLAFQYLPDNRRVLNLGFTYARSGDPLSGVQTTKAINNLKVTDVSAAWPVFSNFSAIGRWSQNWNQEHLQNLLYGLQYDTCCWAARLVGGRAFIGFNPKEKNKPMYNDEISIQFSLKGLGDIENSNPGGLLSSIPGYST